MGCPDVYYKKFLISFLRNLRVAINMLELSEDDLESMVLLKKQNITEKEFYYEAGLSVARTIDEIVISDSYDKINACIGGLANFEEFIGIKR